MTLRERVITVVVCLVLAGLLLLIASATTARELKRARKRALGETVIGAEGLLAGEIFYTWRSFNWALRNVAIEPGTPAIMQFDFLAGTIPGAALVGVAAQAAYVLGKADHAPARTQSKEIVRVPVPADQESDAQELLAVLRGSPGSKPRAGGAA